MIKKRKQAGCHVYETKEWIDKHKNKKMINVDDAIIEMQKGKKIGNKYFSYEKFYLEKGKLKCETYDGGIVAINEIIDSENTNNFWFVVDNTKPTILQKIYYRFMLLFYKKPKYGKEPTCGYVLYSMLIKGINDKIVNDLRKIPLKDKIVSIEGIEVSEILKRIENENSR